MNGNEAQISRDLHQLLFFLSCWGTLHIKLLQSSNLAWNNETRDARVYWTVPFTYVKLLWHTPVAKRATLVTNVTILFPPSIPTQLTHTRAMDKRKRYANSLLPRPLPHDRKSIELNLFPNFENHFKRIQLRKWATITSKKLPDLIKKKIDCQKNGTIIVKKEGIKRAAEMNLELRENLPIRVPNSIVNDQNQGNDHNPLKFRILNPKWWCCFKQVVESLARNWTSVEQIDNQQIIEHV